MINKSKINFDLDEKWNEYVIKFAMLIRDKYKKGIQFTDESSPFQNQGSERKKSIDSTVIFYLNLGKNYK